MPRHVKASFFGMKDHELDRWTEGQKMAEAAMKFYGDGSKLAEVYGS